MKTSRPSPFSSISLTLGMLGTLVISLTAGLAWVQNSDLGVSNEIGSQIARAGIEGEEIPVPYAG